MCKLLESSMGIIGVIVGWVLNYLSNSGKITLHSSNCRMFFIESDGGGSWYEKELSKDSTGGSMKFELLIYNTSNKNRIIKEMSVLLKSNIIESHSKIIDEDSERIIAQRSVCDDLEYLNIPPNSITKKHLRISFGKDEVREIFGKEVRVSLVGKKLYGLKRKFDKNLFSISEGKPKNV